jgi:ABC-type glycerol-3-phosphate transport system substrate-binding protein
MKPLGMTADFRIVRPSRVEDLIWEAIREAVTANWTPTQAIQEMWQSWEQALRDDAKSVGAEFRKALK